MADIGQLHRSVQFWSLPIFNIPPASLKCPVRMGHHCLRWALVERILSDQFPLSSVPSQLGLGSTPLLSCFSLQPLLPKLQH